MLIKKSLMNVVSVFFIVERHAENALFENWHPALLKTRAEHCNSQSTESLLCHLT